LAEKKAANAQHKPSYYEWRKAAYHKKRKWQNLGKREAAKRLLHSKLGT